MTTSKMASLSRLRTRNSLIIAGLVGFIGLALYPIVVSPMVNPKKWQKVQKETRKGIDQAGIQPGGMRVWSDPFAPRSDKPTDSKAT
ncbi:small integral membrane protein 20-like [Patiria miniata]|uniref:Small integral membrane protein 20-like n=1 Tax=Patiria miniata TaxID=46514 RepID=A0A914A0Q1_PATMI|nr:small integral membrane protein 20-like [Patiria miniata]XP_038057170.1 small integral membrane protein 20-like [Patiria miniata]